MAATIKIKNSSTASAVPTSSDLVQGELAVNVTDKRLFTENASGTVVELGTNPTILTLPDGSASAPTLTNDGDTNTGIFFPAADTVGITTGGSERLRVDSGGNLGLGATPSAWGSPFKAFQFGSNGGSLNYRTDSNQAVELALNWFYDGTNSKYINSNWATRYRQFSGAHEWYTAASGTAGNTITFTQAMTLDASGNLGVGSTSPAMSLNGNTRALYLYKNDTNGAGVRLESSNTNFEIIAGDSGVLMYSTGDDPIRFGTSNTERARIDSSGNLLVGRTSTADATVGGLMQPSGRIIGTMAATTNSTDTLTVYSTGASAYRFYVGMGGTIYATSTSITAISDATLKTNVRDLETGLTQVMALRPRRFDWINGDATNVAGFVAQEVEEVLPELVDDYRYSVDEEGNDIIKKSLKMGDILPTLVKAIQEQQALITALTARIEALEQA